MKHVGELKGSDFLLKIQPLDHPKDPRHTRNTRLLGGLNDDSPFPTTSTTAVTATIDPGSITIDLLATKGQANNT